MTNKEYIATLTNEELATYIYKGIVEVIGRRYNSSVGGVADWLGQEHHKSDDYDYLCMGGWIRDWMGESNNEI